jgi:hypothetical protein
MGQFEPMLRMGATLELCMCDPELLFESLGYLSRYLRDDAQNVLQHFVRARHAALADEAETPWQSRGAFSHD